MKSKPSLVIHLVAGLILTGMLFAQGTQFQMHVDYASGQGPVGVAVGDLNGDGRPDLVTSNVGITSSTVSVLLGNGDGTFQPHVDYPTATGPNSGYVAIGDFNGDGKPDLAVTTECGSHAQCTDSTLGALSILLGNGDGSFQTHVDYSTQIDPGAVVVEDFNGDGKLDLAVANYGPDFAEGTVSIFLGKGDGSFDSVGQYDAGVNPIGLVADDFNHDSNIDLITGDNNGSQGISVLLGNGDGSFQKATNYPAGGNPRLGAVADFNSDGNLDLAVANYFYQNEVWLGNGDGSFRQQGTFKAEMNPSAVGGGNFNEDGKFDLVTVNGGSNSVSVVLGNGDGTFSSNQDYAVGAGPNAVAVADLNGDGALDFAVTNGGDNTVSVLLHATTVALSETNLNFDVQLVGTRSVSQTVTLTNTGGLPLTVSSISVTGDFIERNTCAGGLPPGGSCKIDVAFQPRAKAMRSGTISITDNAADSPQTITLTGTGTVVQVSWSSLNFGDQKVGTSSSPQKVSVTNRGTDPLKITNISLGGQNFTDFIFQSNCPPTLAAGASCQVSVTFSPKAKGSRQAALTIGDDGGGSPQKVSLSGNGI